MERILRSSGTRALAAAAATALALLAGAAGAPGAGPPLPDPAFLAPGMSELPCESKAYPECRRLRFAYGPLPITPGDNMDLIGPVTIEKPAYDGYMVRMDGNLVDESGRVPPVDVVHLHHGVWFSLPSKHSAGAPSKAAGALNPALRGGVSFFGAGEEKTTFSIPDGYGMPVAAAENWEILYMIHNTTPDPKTVWITYDVDFVPKEAADRRGIKRAVPLWLDVARDVHPDYPVFNVQRGYGHVNPKTGKRECAYPREKCAAFDSFGKPQHQQGQGWDYRVPREADGTIVAIQGHLHPGGLRDELSVIRTIDGRERARRLFNSEAKYWDPGGPISWDMSMTVSKPDYRVRLREGDKLRLNAIYDAEYASWYEGMGIVFAWVSPRDTSGVDPFTKVAVRRKGRTRMRYVRLPVNGEVTHGHLPENDHHGGERERPLPAKDGNVISTVQIANFLYSQGDLTSGGDTLPQVRGDQPLTFTNLDAAANIWHTITTCAPPCTGTAGIRYPLADALPPIDSSELGWTVPVAQAASQRTSFQIVPSKAGLKTGETVTYFCRVHPFMRGGFKIVK